MKMSGSRSLLFASLLGLAVSTSWVAGSGCRPASDQGSNEGTGGSGTGGKNDGTGGKSDGTGGKSDGTGGKNDGTGGKNDGTGGKSDGTGGSGSGTGGSGSGTGGSGSGSGGSSSGGGTTGSTSTAAGPTGTTVTFAKGKANGALAGYGWVSLGSQDTVTDPLCGTAAITSTTTCAATTWSTTDSLCISGTVPALPATPAASDYSSNWGVEIGINATDPAGGTVEKAWSTISITVSGSPSSGLRAQVHVKGDGDDKNYCLTYASGPMQLSKFATDCYAGTPTGLIASGDIGKIDKVELMVPSSGTAASVSKLCITKIDFGS